MCYRFLRISKEIDAGYGGVGADEGGFPPIMHDTIAYHDRKGYMNDKYDFRRYPSATKPLNENMWSMQLYTDT
ncbi:hypothetical protein LXL04_023534 [Taraxacum kok-saghyz]